MARRVIAIPLAVAIAIAVFSSSVFGVTPDNNLSGQYRVGIRYSSNNVSSGYSLGSFDFGSNYFEKFSVSFSGSSDSPYHSTSFDFSLDSTNTIYVLCRSYALSDITFSGGAAQSHTLEQYRVDSKNLTDSVDVPVSYKRYVFPSLSADPTITTINSFTQNFGLTYVCFEDVPPGNYPIFDRSLGGSDPTYGNYYWLVTGIYIDVVQSASDIVDDYLNGDLSLSDAIGSINNIVNSELASATTFDQKTFILLRNEYEINRILQASDSKSIDYITNTVNPSFDSILSSFSSGNVSLSSALTNLSSVYSSALQAAETPEQGILVNTSYQIKLKQFELDAMQQAKEKMDSAVSDDQLSEADDYYESEEELINLFEVAEFESALDFELWFNTLPPSEATQYKRFFDYILNDSSIRMFLIVPISLILVRIIFGTVLRLRVRHD